MKLREVKTDKLTIKSGHLDVGNGHKIWFEQWGNKKAKTPVLFFHGGPGSSYQPKHKYRFDPHVHQVIGFDQRGSGNSTPYGRLKHNTTDDLLADTVKLLNHLGVDKAYVYGGSWGSTMALLFAIKHSDRVKATLVHGVFTGSKAEIDYIDKGLFENFYPEVWQRFLTATPKTHRSNPVSYHYAVLAGQDKTKFAKSAKALEELERPLLKFDWHGYEDLNPDQANEEEYDYVPYQILAQYFNNNCFLPDGYILGNAKSIKTPLLIIQGRYDMVCPPATAYKLHQAVPGSRLYMTLGSHAGSDPENRTALKTLTDSVFT